MLDFFMVVRVDLNPIQAWALIDHRCLAVSENETESLSCLYKRITDVGTGYREINR